MGRYYVGDCYSNEMTDSFDKACEERIKGGGISSCAFCIFRDLREESYMEINTGILIQGIVLFLKNEERV